MPSKAELKDQVEMLEKQLDGMRAMRDLFRTAYDEIKIERDTAQQEHAVAEAAIDAWIDMHATAVAELAAARDDLAARLETIRAFVSGELDNAG